MSDDYICSVCGHRAGDHAVSNRCINDCDCKDDPYLEQLSALQAKLDDVEDILHKISNWCDAYPLDIFTEPDWNKVRSLLGADLLSCVSASCMRHVVNGVKEYAEEALKKLEEK